MSSPLVLVSHHLCPYVQRAAISLAEKGVPFERRSIDLANKPGWFLDVSPLSKVPVLLHDGHAIFESAVILEYLEETQPNPLHPDSALDRAVHRSWIEFGSALLNDIARFYNAADSDALNAARSAIAARLARLAAELGAGPWFAGARFSLVDTVFAPVFRYFDTFETIADFGFFEEAQVLMPWRARLARRPSVANAVDADYPARLRDFLRRRGSALTARMVATA